MPVCVCLFLCRGFGSPGSCSPSVCPVCGLVFRCLSFVAFGVRYSLWAPSRRPAYFLKVSPGYVSQPTPCGIDCQVAEASSGTSVRRSCRNFGHCIITVMLPNFLVETSDSCVEMFVSTVGLLRVCIVVSRMATPAPTSAPSMAPTMISTIAPTMALACAEGAHCAHVPNVSPTSEEPSNDFCGFMMTVHLRMWR